MFIWACVNLLYVKMVDTDEIEGPTLVWTFPLVTRFQKRRGILNFGQTASDVSQKVDDVREDKPVRTKVSDAITEAESSDDDKSVDEIEEKLDEVSNQSETIFDAEDYGQPDDILDEGAVIEISDEVFVPVRTEIDEGEEVEWVNNDDTTHSVLSINNEQIESGDIEPGESYTQTFEEEGVVKFIDPVVGGDEMCGAIIVGDAELNEELRCEESPDRELFDDDEDDLTTDDGRTMSQAASEKEDMDIGFND